MVTISPWDMKAAGPNLIAMALLIVFYWIFFAIIESQLYTKCKRQPKKVEMTMRET